MFLIKSASPNKKIESIEELGNFIAEEVNSGNRTFQIEKLQMYSVWASTDAGVLAIRSVTESRNQPNWVFVNEASCPKYDFQTAKNLQDIVLNSCYIKGVEIRKED